MHQSRNPASLGAPGGHYSHAIEVSPNARWLYLSGQVGATPDGVMPTGITAQAENCWRNVTTILAEAGMGLADIVHYQVCLTRKEDMGGYREVRDRVLGDARPASLLVISELVRQGALIEIGVVAAKV
jgi:2-iminobutanoate/2-iminopropanoate deaminase